VTNQKRNANRAKGFPVRAKEDKEENRKKAEIRKGTRGNSKGRKGLSRKERKNKDHKMPFNTGDTATKKGGVTKIAHSDRTKPIDKNESKERVREGGKKMSPAGLGKEPGGENYCHCGQAWCKGKDVKSRGLLKLGGEQRLPKGEEEQGQSKKKKKRKPRGTRGTTGYLRRESITTYSDQGEGGGENRCGGGVQGEVCMKRELVEGGSGKGAGGGGVRRF